MIQQTVFSFKLQRAKEKITARSGLAMFAEFFKAMGVEELVDKYMPGPCSGRGFDPSRYIKPLCMSIYGGGQSIEDVREIREDESQMVRYYGHYSNVSRGKRKKEDNDELIPSILEPDGSPKEYRRNWARLIQKISEVDPLTCPKCQGKMRIIAFIEDEEVIKKILKHLGLW